MSIDTVEISNHHYQVYATELEADTYLAVDPQYRTAWAALEDLDKQANLVAATRQLDLLVWAGEPAAAGQTGAWPRSGLTDPNGQAQSESDVPLDVEHATILLAGSLALNPLALTAGQTNDNIQSQRAGPKQVTYFHRSRSTLDQLIPDSRIRSLLAYWLNVGSAATLPVVTGTDGVSEFEPLNRYGRTVGIG